MRPGKKVFVKPDQKENERRKLFFFFSGYLFFNGRLRVGDCENVGFIRTFDALFLCYLHFEAELASSMSFDNPLSEPAESFCSSNYITKSFFSPKTTKKLAKKNIVCSEFNAFTSTYQNNTIYPP